MPRANLMALVFIEPDLTADRSFTLREWVFCLCCSCDLDLDPMTFVYELNP